MNNTNNHKFTKEELNNLSVDEWNKIYLDYFMEQFRQSTEDIKNGRYISPEESKERIKKKYEALLHKENR